MDKIIETLTELVKKLEDIERRLNELETWVYQGVGV